MRIYSIHKLLLLFWHYIMMETIVWIRIKSIHCKSIHCTAWIGATLLDSMRLNCDFKVRDVSLGSTQPHTTSTWLDCTWLGDIQPLQYLTSQSLSTWLHLTVFTRRAFTLTILDLALEFSTLQTNSQYFKWSGSVIAYCSAGALRRPQPAPPRQNTSPCVAHPERPSSLSRGLLRLPSKIGTSRCPRYPVRYW